MPLKPFDLVANMPSTAAAAIPADLQETIFAASDIAKDEKTSRLNEARQIFDDAGCDLKTMARTVAGVMANGFTDAGKLKAVELGLKVKGIINEMESKPLPVINITVNSGDGSKTLVNLVLPTN
jgi:hypothetical protein